MGVRLKLEAQKTKYYQRIEFWILIFFVVRLVGITNPPLETGHNWRQVTGLMVSRNFLEVDANILYPRVDDHQGGTGIIGMEFPSMNYIFYLASSVFGYDHWYGRLINLIVSSLGLLFFYRLARICEITERVACTATLLLASSIWFTFSRKMMPDTYCISLVFIAIYYAIRYLKEGQLFQLILYLTLGTLAVLSKIPAGIYLVLLLPFLFSRKWPQTRRLMLAVGSVLPLGLTYWWYFIWNPHLADTYGNWYNAGKPIQEGFLEIVNNLGPTLDKFYFNAFASYIVFALFIAGLVLMLVRKQKQLLVAFGLTSTVFVVYIFKSGFFFYHHSYYIIPFVPIMALLAGYALSFIQKKWVFLTVLILGIGESIANKQHDFFIKDKEKYKLEIAKIMDDLSQPYDLIALNGNSNPQLIYLSHRKGWNCSNDELYDSAYVTMLAENNCRFLVVHKHAEVDLNQISLNWPITFENDNFRIYKLQ